MNGADGEEPALRALRGDAVLPGAVHTLTRVAQIDAPPAAVWPWVCQMLRGGGMYGCELLETPECASADHLLDRIPPARAGDRLGGCLELAGVTPGRELVWAATPGCYLMGLPLPPLTIDYHLGPADGVSLLTIRLRVGAGALTLQASTYLCRVVDVVLTRHQASRLKPRAEARGGRGRAATSRVHQAAPLVPAAGFVEGARPWLAMASRSGDAGGAGHDEGHRTVD